MTQGRITGKRVLITGAGAGIGRATAIRFAQEGARVALVDHDAAALQALQAEIAGTGGRALSLRADVADEVAVAAAVDGAVTAWQGLDVIVANAAVQLHGEDARADALDLSVWRRTIDINLTGVFLTCKHGLRALLAAGGGSVICTASPTSLFGVAAGYDAYTASKAGVLGLVRVMAHDYASHGIRVNAVIPGFTDTPLVREIMADDAQREHLLRGIPLRRPGRAEEVAAMMLFLASDEASYSTGAAFFVDGGMTAI